MKKKKRNFFSISTVVNSIPRISRTHLDYPTLGYWYFDSQTLCSTLLIDDQNGKELGALKGKGRQNLPN